MQQNLVGLAFTAGLVAALNPCGFALLPAYLALVVRGDRTSPNTPASGLVAVGRAVAATAAMGLGFLAVFGMFGLLAASVATAAHRYAPYVTVLIGIVLVAFGAWLLAGRKLALLNPIPLGPRWAPTARVGSMFAYGVGYAIASLSCTIAPFLAITGASFRTAAIFDGLWVYLAYGIGMTLIAGVLAIAMALARETLIERARRIMPYLNRITGVLLLVVGLYVGYYGIYEVRLFSAGGNPEDPVIAAAGLVQGTLAGWVHQQGAWPWVVAGVVLVASAGSMGLVAAIRRKPAATRVPPG